MYAPTIRHTVRELRRPSPRKMEGVEQYAAKNLAGKRVDRLNDTEKAAVSVLVSRGLVVISVFDGRVTLVD